MGLFSKQQKAADGAAADQQQQRCDLEQATSAPALLHDGARGGSSGAQPVPAVSRAKSEPTQQQQLAQIDTLTAAQKRTLSHMQVLSRVMDNAVTIPIIKRRIGLDAVIGLVPYAGDMAGGAMGTYIISRALKYNMPKRLVLRMLLNQAIDSCVGIIPFVGDIFDIGFKANTRNMKLLQEHLEHPKSATHADTCFLFGLFILVVVVPVLLMAGIVAAIIVGALAAAGKLH